MGANYDASTYVPGAAWTNKDFYASALTTPRLTAVTNGGSITGTTPSYFEHRGGPGENDKIVHVAVSGTGTTATLQMSLDDGSTWQTVQNYTAPANDTFVPIGLAMYKLVAGTGNPVLTLTQP